MNTHQVILVRSGIRLRDENLDRKHRNDDDPQRKKGKKQKGNLQELPADLFPLGKVIVPAPAAVDKDAVVPELRPVDLDALDALDVPPQGEVDLLDLPVLEEDGAPDAGQDAVG